MKVIITGSSGFIGGHLMRSLRSHFELLGMDLPNDDINDITRCESIIRSFKPDVICHQAALPSVPESFNRPVETFHVNLAGTLNLARLAHEVGARLVVASTSAVKGNSPYGKSKLAMENALADMGINHCVLRYFNVFGPYQPMRTVVPIWINAVVKNEPVVVFGSDRIERDFTHIDNVIRANYVAITGKDVGVFEVGGGQPISLRHVYETIKKHFNPKHDKYTIGESRFGDLLRSESSRDLWITEPIISFEEGIQKWASMLGS